VRRSSLKRTIKIAAARLLAIDLGIIEPRIKYLPCGKPRNWSHKEDQLIYRSFRELGLFNKQGNDT
jgi:hypothetical protein